MDQPTQELHLGKLRRLSRGIGDEQGVVPVPGGPAFPATPASLVMGLHLESAVSGRLIKSAGVATKENCCAALGMCLPSFHCESHARVKSPRGDSCSPWMHGPDVGSSALSSVVQLGSDASVGVDASSRGRATVRAFAGDWL